MSGKGLWAWVLYCLLFYGNGMGQQDSISMLLENQNLEIVFDDPVWVKKVCLNDRDLSALLKIEGISQKEITIINDYKKVNGDFAHPLELYQIQGLPIEIIHKMLPFVEVEDGHSVHGRRQFSHSLMVRFRQSNGSNNVPLNQNMGNQLLRYSGGRGNFKWGGMITKDSGESWGEHYLFKSGYVKWTSANNRASVILGDYTFQWGQGLLGSSSFLTVPSWRIQTFIQPPPDIRPFTSTMEVLSKRGVISKFSFKKGLLIIGINEKKLHGAWVSESSFIPTTNSVFSDSTSISKFEAARRNGFFLFQQWRFKSNQLGIGCINDTIRRINDRGLWGNSKWTISWNRQRGNHHLFSEFAFFEMKFKCVMGGLFSLHPSVRLGLFFAKSQFNQMPSGFSHSFRQQLEWQVNTVLTIYGGVSLQKKWSQEIPVDFIKRNFFLEWEWKPKRHHQFYYRLVREHQWVLQPLGNTYDAACISDLTHRFDVVISIGSELKFHTRFEFSLKERLKERAQYYFFEWDYHPFDIPFSCVFRYTSFDADDWEMRRYTMERGVSGSYNMLALYGTGERLCFLVKWNPGRFNIQCKVHGQGQLQRTRSNRWASGNFGARSVGVELLLAFDIG